MKGILADVNIQGHVDLLVVLMQAEPWKFFWDYLHLQYLTSPTSAWPPRRWIPWYGKRVNWKSWSL